MINPMRIRSLDSVTGLTDLTKDVNKHFKRPITMIEIGAYLGESTQIFYNNIELEKLIVIDAWEPTRKYKIEEISAAKTIFDALHSNNPKISAYQLYSTDELFNDFTADFVYIDANHDYEFVSQDIDFWLPKVKAGGIIAGHDYTAKFDGVIKAVNERFNPKKVKIYKDTSWLIKL